MNNTNLLLRHNYVQIPSDLDVKTKVAVTDIVTICMNLEYYGFALSNQVFSALQLLDINVLQTWWLELEKELKSVSGEDRKIGNFVVYKNFPSEVLSKTDAEYWLPQILMYWGFPKEYFTEEVAPRPEMKEATKSIVLHQANAGTFNNILNRYIQTPVRWKNQEQLDAVFLAQTFFVDFTKFSFKENLIQMTKSLMDNGFTPKITTATDVLRLAAGLSNGDVSLREKVKFISFKKPMRRALLSMLENCKNLSEDMARHPEIWKRFMHQLHAGDYHRAYPKVCKAQDNLYKDNLETFNSKIEALFINNDEKVIDELVHRPGDFRRRLVQTIKMFGSKASNKFTAEEVLSKLSTSQIVTLRSFLETLSAREHRVFPPKGNWNKLQIAKGHDLDKDTIKSIFDVCQGLTQELSKRLPKISYLDERTKLIKLATSASEGDVSPYARGTRFPIPENVKFIRTASYWKQKGCTAWFDNGWNFFDYNYKSVGVCSWDSPKLHVDGTNHYTSFWNRKPAKQTAEVAAVFSGDPVNSKEMEGRAAQFLDLYPEQLRKMGVRYAVWNILCFSRIPFGDAEDVFAALQWGENADDGQLFEPSRCQLSFKLIGKSFTKYVCLFDLKTNEMVYIDANLHANTNSAARNIDSLEKNLPPFMEYVETLPSVHDLFRDTVAKDGSIQVLYSDKDHDLKDVDAYVFKTENKNNAFKQVNINKYL